MIKLLSILKFWEITVSCWRQHLQTIDNDQDKSSVGFIGLSFHKQRANENMMWHHREVSYRPHTTVTNARNLKSVSQSKLAYFEEIYKLWTHEPRIPVLSSNIHQFCIPNSSCFMRETAAKQISLFLKILMLYEVKS